MQLARWIVLFLPYVDCGVLAWLLTSFVSVGPAGSIPLRAASLLVIPVSLVLFRKCGVYDSHRVELARTVIGKLVLGHAAAFGTVLLGSVAFGLTDQWKGLVAAYSFSLVIQLAGKGAMYAALNVLRRRGYDTHHLIFIGPWKQAEAFYQQSHQHPEWGLTIDAVRPVASGDFFSFSGREPLGRDAEDILTRRIIQDVVISVGGDVPLAEAFEHARFYGRYGLQVRFIFEPLKGSAASTEIIDRDSFQAISVVPSPRSDRDLAIKRIFDVVCASTLLLVAAPLMLVVAAAIKLTSPGPVIFKQVRVGLYGRRFYMYKFRSMVDGAESLVRHAHRSITNGPVFKDVSDYRITPLGRIIRRFSIDELPQLWNVLIGDMSMVGPRPLPVHEAEKVAGDYRRRFSVPPGLTCIWQVSGRSTVTYERWMQYDLLYVNDWSLWSDTKLIFKTIPALLTGRGAY